MHKIKDLLSRPKFLFEKNENECYILLGNAFHYLQTNGRFGSGPEDKHAKWETMVEHKLLGEKKILLIIEKSALPEKYKKAYITYIKIFIEDLESSTFSGHQPFKWQRLNMVVK